VTGAQTVTVANATPTVTAPPTTLENATVQKSRTAKHKPSQVIVLYLSGALNAADAQNLGIYALATVPRGRRRARESPCPR
jgi:hypothetical protein